MRLSHVLPGLTLQGRAAGRLENTFEDMKSPKSYMNYAYYDQLRTGYPEFCRAAGVNLPYRWMYPQDEYNNNVANVEAALQSQFGGNDRTSDPLWWLK